MYDLWFENVITSNKEYKKDLMARFQIEAWEEKDVETPTAMFAPCLPSLVIDPTEVIQIHPKKHRDLLHR